MEGAGSRPRGSASDSAGWLATGNGKPLGWKKPRWLLKLRRFEEEEDGGIFVFFLEKKDEDMICIYIY